MDWTLAALGNARGAVELDGARITLPSEGAHACALSSPADPDGALVLRSDQGKLGDAEDSFLFLGVRIAPRRQNFTLSAVFTLLGVGERVGWQAGYGLFAVDALACESSAARYRNVLSAGRHRGTRYDAYTCGLRAVAGHRD
ncbi:MAG: hypothetical protein IJ594_11100, partial [Oscillospiraceae bacterium]|nr:hypothetical protein [Oscillospiraceae bacterium]